jgi:oxygen-independent coproporphyrinogen-3 oxidase
VSLEANPEDWSDEIGAAYLDGGVTRVTLGVQSLDDGVLGSLGRVHVGEQAVSAVASARRSGVPSVGIDLMYGAPGESLDSWRATVTKALALGVDHVSAYALTVEPGTALASAVTAGAPGPDPDDQADKYELFDALAAGAGLIRYEVSNWARPGHVCRYNLSTWAQGEYAAFGLGAHGHRGGRRTRNARVLDVYLDRVESASSPQVAVEEVAGWSREQERLMVGLRRAAGVVAGWGGEILAGSEEGKRLIAAGVLELRAGRLVVSRPLLTDEVVRAVLALKEPQGAGRAWLSLSPRDC